MSGQHHHTQSASGWRRMAASGQEVCALAKTNQHQTLNSSLLLLTGTNNFLDWFSLYDITIKPLCHSSSHGGHSWSPAVQASKGQSLWGCVGVSKGGWVCLTLPKLGATPFLPAAPFGYLRLHRAAASRNDPCSKRHWYPTSHHAAPGDAAFSQELQVSCCNSLNKQNCLNQR